MPRLLKSKCHCQVSLYGNPPYHTRVSVNAGRNIDRQYKSRTFIDPPDCVPVAAFDVTRKTDSKQCIYYNSIFIYFRVTTKSYPIFLTDFFLMACLICAGLLFSDKPYGNRYLIQKQKSGDGKSVSAVIA